MVEKSPPPLVVDEPLTVVEKSPPSVVVDEPLNMVEKSPPSVEVDDELPLEVEDELPLEVVEKPLSVVEKFGADFFQHFVRVGFCRGIYKKKTQYAQQNSQRHIIIHRMYI